MSEVVIVSAVRTPIGRYLGTLRDVPAHELGARVLQAAVERAGVTPEKVDEVIMGQSYQNGESVNIARTALLAAGWPVEIPGFSLDRRCCSGLDAISLGAMKIQSGHADIVAAGGIENMSRTEFYIPGELIKWGIGGRQDPKWGFMPRGHGSLSLWGLPLFDRIARSRVMSQPIERFGELNSMMSWAEAAAAQENISRADADQWALRSHQRAGRAIAEGRFAAEIVPVPIPQPKGDPLLFEQDETPRPDTTLEQLSRLRPVYPDGVCTAGNSSTENDGAAAVLLMGAQKARTLGIPPLATLKSFAVAATDPTLTYPAVPAAVQRALNKAGLGLDQIDLIEVQEAFAVQVLADLKLIGLAAAQIDRKVNVNGSGISLGHPIAATGTIRMVTLLHEMRRRQVRFGLETICGGGGQGIAAVVENPAGKA